MSNLKKRNEAAENISGNVFIGEVGERDMFLSFPSEGL
jgi:hypothetical protein